MKSDDDPILSKLPARLANRLMSFQKDGVKFAVSRHGRCLIADEMGLGKTIQAISVAYYYRTEWPLLIIVPSSIRFCWIEELEKWLPDIQPCDINLIRGGNHASEISSAQITLVTYGLLSKQTSHIVKEALANQNFKVVICDESHYIRNTRTASYKAVVPLVKNACRRIFLSGTPALARPVELFGQIDALKPGGFGTWWEFTSRYCDARYEWIGRQKMRKVDGASNLEELQERLSSSVMIRREKQEVLTELPPKQRQKVLFELKDSSLKTDILKMFDELKPTLQKNVMATSLSLDAATQETENASGDSLHRLSLISKLYKLSGEAKIGPVKEYLEMLCENTSLKFLVFAYHHVMMNGLQQTLYDKKVKFIRIDGETHPEDRMLYVKQFQSDPETKVAILSILAAGVGLTLTATKLVVFAELYWTPGVMLQCEDRAHRIGQTASLPVHYLVAKGTMDEWVWSTVCKKTVVTSTALTGKGRQLDADKGDKYQVDVLSGADAWIPSSQQTDIDLQTFFQSQKPNDQKSILDFFTSPSAKRKNRIKSSAPTFRRKGSHVDETDQLDRKKQKTESSILDEIVVIDSDEEAEQFKEGKRRKFKGRQHSGDNTEITLVDISIPTESQTHDILCSRQASPVLTPKSKKVSRTGQKAESEQWSCTTCTFLNVSFLPRCEMCNTPSKTRSKVTSTDSMSKTNLRKIQQKTNASLPEIETADTEVNGHTQHLDNSSDNPVKLVRDKLSSYEIQSIPMCAKQESFKLILSKSENEIFVTPNAEKNYSGPNEVGTKKRKCSLFDADKYSSLPENDVSEAMTSSSPPAHGLYSDEEWNDSSSEEDLLNPRTVTPRRKKRRRCFQFDLDLPRTGLMSNAVDAEASASTMTTTSGGVTSVPCPPSQDSGFVSTPGHGAALVSASWDLSPCSSPCFKLELESSGDISCQKDQSLENLAYHEDQDLETTRCVKESDRSLSPAVSPSGSVVSPRGSIASPRGSVASPIDSAENDSVASTSQTTSAINSHVVNSAAPPLLHDDDRTEDILPDLILPRRRRKSTNKETTKKTPGKTKTGNKPESPEISAVQSVVCLPSTTHTTNQQRDAASSNDGFDHRSSGSMSNIQEPERSSVPPHSVKETSPSYEPAGRENGSDSDATFTMFLYMVSPYTGRVYLSDQMGEPLNENFLPLDVEMGNMDELPQVLHHHGNLRLVQKFVREWNSLSETKKRLIVKRGMLFKSPLATYDDVRSGKTVNTQRHRTKDDAATVARKMAGDLNGSLRLISKRGQTGSQETNDQQMHDGRGVLQAVTPEGVPLCLSCQQPYRNSLLMKSTITSADNAWNTRFCSAQCMDKYWIQTHSGYCREKVYEVEHGICQMCKCDAHTFYRQIRDTKELDKRAKLLSGSRFASLKAKLKETMVRKPVEGQFWHVDHITPVWEGGGMCDIDNMRTLCVVCHHKVTAGQARKRAVVRRIQGASAGGADITAFFQRS